MIPARCTAWIFRFFVFFDAGPFLLAGRRNNRKQKRPTAPFLGQSAPPVVAIASLRPAHTGPVSSPAEPPNAEACPCWATAPPPRPLDPRILPPACAILAPGGHGSALEVSLASYRR